MGEVRVLNLPPDFERAIWERVDSGKYESAVDVLDAALHALEMWEEDEAEQEDELRALIQEGIDESDRGEAIPGEQAIAEIRAELRRRFGHSDS